MNYWQVIIGILGGALAGLAILPPIIKLGHRFSLLDHPGKHKRHKKPTPILGGVALFVTVWVTVLVVSMIFNDAYQELIDSSWYVLSGAAIILLVGLADDLSPLSAWAKLAAQIGAGLILYLGGLQVELLSTPYGSVELGGFSIFFTILWVVMLTNAVNLIDGLDGLASGVSLIGASVLIIIGQLYQVGPVMIIMTSMTGFLIIFMRFNSYPAKVFLGDSGSMQIGYYFAVFSLVFPLKSYTFSALYLPVLILGVPILETASSFLRRLMSGKNIMAADRRHLFHYLSLAGFSAKQIVTIFYSTATIFGLFALAMFFWDRMIVFGYLVFFMVVIFSLFFIIITNISPRKKGNGTEGNGGNGLWKHRDRLR